MSETASTEHLGLRERKKRETARAIEVAALELVSESSLVEVTIEAISQRADVTSRTFFNYYAGKEDAVLGNSRAFPPPDLHDLTVEPGGSVVDAVLDAVLADFEAFDLGRPDLEKRKRAIMIENPDLLAKSFRTLGDLEENLARQVSRVLAQEAVVPEPLPDPERENRAWAVVFLVGAVMRLALRNWSLDSDTTHPVAHHIAEARQTLLAAAGR
ncbi:TetR/AcrR family transcriptional regulator [Herbiconiux sp. P15]|uniref:TetR/AcrR family transcriptional regulator n=1 Tax=Herbiconiux liukaitaii TaxID=3342799 RepID=UPI0035B7FFD4